MMRCVSWLLLLAAVMVSANPTRVERQAACDESCRCTNLLKPKDIETMASVTQGCVNKASSSFTVKPGDFKLLDDNVKNCAIHEFFKQKNQLDASEEINVTSMTSFVEEVITSKKSIDAKDYAIQIANSVPNCAASAAGDTKDLDFYKCLAATCVKALKA